MPVADRHVALVPERVIRQSVRLQVEINVAVGPVEDRMHLEPAIPHFERIQLRAALGLAATQPGEPGLRAERLQSAAHRLDLADLEIFVEALATLLPELAVLRL